MSEDTELTAADLTAEKVTAGKVAPVQVVVAMESSSTVVVPDDGAELKELEGIWRGGRHTYLRNGQPLGENDQINPGDLIIIARSHGNG